MDKVFKARFIWTVVYWSILIMGGRIDDASAQNILGKGGSTSDSLKYIGHSFVKINTIDGTVIYIDPYAVHDFADSADIVLITHEHSDHNDLSCIRQKSTCQVIRAATAVKNNVFQSFTVGTVKITKISGVAAYNSQPRNKQWHVKYQCVGYLLEFDGIKLYHAGDTGNIPEMADLASQNITYALLPMDSIYTMSPAEATEAAAMIQAQHDIPIHTMPPPDSYSDAMVARFTSPNKMIVRPGSTIELLATPTNVANRQIPPADFRLEQNYPNPFNPTTMIRYALLTTSRVHLRIYDELGQVVADLVNAEQPSGRHQSVWNAAVSSGLYFYRLEATSLDKTGLRFVETKKMLLLR